MFLSREKLENEKWKKPKFLELPEDEALYLTASTDICFAKNDIERAYSFYKGPQIGEALDIWMEKISFCGKDVKEDIAKAFRDVKARTAIGYKLGNIADAGNVVASQIDQINRCGPVDYSKKQPLLDKVYSFEFHFPDVVTRNDFLYETLNEGSIMMTSTFIKKLYFEKKDKLEEIMDEVY